MFILHIFKNLIKLRILFNFEFYSNFLILFDFIKKFEFSYF
jgi:hypothetical protein